MDELIELLKNFDIKFSEVNDLLKCTICKNVLIDAYVAPCACKFCWCCIENYLKDGDRTCPGTKDECKEMFLKTVRELLKDAASNMQISYLLAKCPNDNCEHRCQLRKMPEHMRMCSKAAVECVFSYVGCVDSCVVEDKMKEHMELKSVAHGRALVAHMRNMENEVKQQMDQYERKLETLATENAMLRQMAEENAAELWQQKEKIRLLSSNEETLTLQNAALKEELQTMRHKSETETIKIKQEIRNLSLKIESDNSKWLTKETDLIHQLEQSKKGTDAIRLAQENFETLRTLFDECERKQRDTQQQIHKIFEGNTAKITKLEEEIRKLLIKVVNYKSEWLTTETDLRRLLAECREQMDTVGRVQGVDISMMDKLIAAVGLDGFVWRIEGINEKLDKTEFSCPFRSDSTGGYKLCLCYCMGSLYGFYLAFHLMRDENNNWLQWPMNRTVLIEIIDENLVPVISRRVCRATSSDRKDPVNRKTAYIKPTEDTAYYGDGFLGCVSYEQIKSIPGAIKNDAITIRCCVLR